MCYTGIQQLQIGKPEPRQSKKMSWGSAIGELVASRGWSHQQLADKIGRSRVYVTRLINDKYENPGLDVLEKIAAAFGLSVQTIKERAGKAVALREDANLEDLVVYLQGEKPSPATIRRIRQIAEVLLKEEKDQPE